MTQTQFCRSLAVALAVIVVVPSARGQEPVKPGPEHAHLKKLEGVWDTTMRIGPMESKGTATYKMDLGGLWLLSRFEGDIAGEKFSGHGADSYDPAKKKYVSLWIDSMSTSIMTMEGTLDKATNTLTLVGEAPDMNRKMVKHKTVSKMPDDNTIQFAMYMGDAKEPAFTILYKRRK
ncbi:MAG TPA: DUF1579 domain-containing protein [Gemmataceae bacterium]|nr:DUF1579 domain-containing protein [Gemmataceae bacterium]